MNISYIDVNVNFKNGVIRLWKLGFSSGILISFLVYQGVYANPILEKAQQELHRGRGAQAQSIYQEYLKQAPHSAPAHQGLATIALRYYDFPKAQTHLEQALALQPENAELAAELGHLFHQWSTSPFEAKNFQSRAAEHFQQAQVLDPDNPTMLTYLALWQLDQQDLVSAEKNLQKALRQNPAYVPAYQGMTEFYIRVKDFGRARETVLHAMELDPQNAHTHFLTARLLAEADHPADALKYAQKSEQLDFGRLPARDYLAASQLEKLGELSQAAEYYKRLVTQFPRHAASWQKLGELYAQSNQMEESIQAYQAAIRLNPELLSDMLNQAQTTTRQGHIPEALKKWRQLAHLMHPSATPLHGLASCYYSLYQNKQTLSAESLHQDIRLFEQQSAGLPDPLLQVDRLKLNIALQQQLTPTLEQQLQELETHTDAATAGEASFILGNYRQAQEQLDFITGKLGAEYLQLADRLYLDGELIYSQSFYQRAIEQGVGEAAKDGIQRVTARKKRAEHHLNNGNTLFEQKNYEAAVQEYKAAAELYPQWESVHLRLGDTYEKLKQWDAAYQAFKTVIALQPTFMESEGFAKKYRKLEKRVAKHAP